MIETQVYGFEKLAAAQLEQGNRVRVASASLSIVSVVAEGFGAPFVAVSLAVSPEMQTGKRLPLRGYKS